MKIGISHEYGMEAYHAINHRLERGSPDWIVSRSDLKDVEQSPEFWKLGGSGFKSTEALKTGELLDALVTEPERFNELFEIVEADRYPPKYKEKEADLGKYLVKRKDLPKYETMAHALRTKRVETWGSTVGDLLADSCHFQVAAFTTYTAHGVTVPLRCLLDVVPEVHWIGDIKTARALDSRSWRRALLYEFGYAMQAAFYLDVYNAAHNGIQLDVWLKTCYLPDEFPGLKEHFLWFLVKNEQPFQAAVRTVDAPFIEQGRQRYLRALDAYCLALATDTWPGFPDDVETYNLNDE